MRFPGAPREGLRSLTVSGEVGNTTSCSRHTLRTGFFPLSSSLKFCCSQSSLHQRHHQTLNYNTATHRATTIQLQAQSSSSNASSRQRSTPALRVTNGHVTTRSTSTTHRDTTAMADETTAAVPVDAQQVSRPIASSAVTFSLLTRSLSLPPLPPRPRQLLTRPLPSPKRMQRSQASKPPQK